jgi:phosphoribosylaminoimidazole-succinocarboxamide synthase
LQDVFPNHFVSADVNDFPEVCHAHAEQLAGRSMLVKKSLPLPVRCVVRGYLTGEGWQEYQHTGGLGGIKLPSGMVESERLPAPLLYPISKGNLSASTFRPSQNSTARCWPSRFGAAR